MKEIFRIRTCIVLLSSCLPLLAVPSAGQETPARRAVQEKEALARIGDELITVDDYRAELERLRERAPNAVATPEEQRRLLDEMVARRALLVRAEAAGYGEHPDVLRIREQMILKTYLHDVLDERLASITVDDAEIEAHYAAHAERYAIPARSRAAVVFYQVSAQAPPERHAEVAEKARAALAEAATLAPDVHHFGEIARRDSDHRGSRYQGGVVGWITHLPEATSPLPPEVTAAVLALNEPGEIGPLVETAEGFYLVRLADREEARSQPLEQVADGIRHQLMGEKRAALQTALDAETRAQLGVEVDDELFDTLDLSTVPQTPPAMPALGESAVRQPGDLEDP